MAIDLKLDDKPWWHALGYGLVIGAILAGAVHYAWFRNLNAEIKGKQAQLEGLQQEIQKGRAAERKLSQFREEVRRLELELGKLLQVLPSKRNTEDLIKRIETLTRQGDFTLRKFTPGDFVPKEFYAEWPIAIALEGTYHNLALFFDRMSRFSRIINVEDLNIGALENVPQKSISANFVAKTFIYTGDETGAPGSATQPAAGAAGASPSLPAPAASSARKLKERAEGGGIE
ncbi:MAG TPA: type 4a pilus biogenesis protein PilO [Thermoanaerobaculia bacterium]|nr:type 4a pilus biogenesis protein PilO [Thermoanaerobaculia bacterium]